MDEALIDERHAVGSLPRERTLLHGEVLGALRDLIVEGRLAPGERLNERALHFEMLVQHARIVECAGNEVLLATYRGLNAHARRARFMANLSPQRWDQAVAEHQRILDALCARDATRLDAELGAHLRHKLRSVRAALTGVTAPETR